MGFTDSCYLAPSLLSQLGKRAFNPIYNYEKSEVERFDSRPYYLKVFSLGVTILETGLLKNV
jgi:hypothetical protein